jgi:hypothetical protein
MSGALPIVWLLVGQVNQSFTTEIRMLSLNSVFFMFNGDSNDIICTYLFMYCNFIDCFGSDSVRDEMFLKVAEFKCLCMSFEVFMAMDSYCGLLGGYVPTRLHGVITPRTTI